MLDIVNSILKSYHSEHHLPADFDKLTDGPVKTRLLKPLIEERGYTDKIHIYETDHESDSIFAMVQMEVAPTGAYSGEQQLAHIYFQQRLNYCWRRFVVCKEMYHCMLDRTDDERANTVEELNRLVELLEQDTSSVSGRFPPYDTERQAELFALETLIPVEYRLQMKDAFNNGKITTKEVANKFRIPEAFVPFSFQPSYLQAVTAYRRPLLF